MYLLTAIHTHKEDTAVSKKIRPTLVSPEIEAFLLQCGPVAKSDDFEIVPEEPVCRNRVKDRFLAQERAESRKTRTANLKKSRIRKAWASSELSHPTGTADRFYNWLTYEREDGFHLYIRKETRRKDPLRVRRALDSAQAKLTEV